MENWLPSPFTFTLLSLTTPAWACGWFCNGDLWDAQCKSPTSERYCCLCFFASAFLCFPPPPFESQCIPFQCGGLEAAITSSHIWDVWAKPLCHQLYLFHFCLNYFWVFFFTFFMFFHYLYANIGSWIGGGGVSTDLHFRQFLLLFQVNIYVHVCSVSAKQLSKICWWTCRGYRIWFLWTLYTEMLGQLY